MDIMVWWYPGYCTARCRAHGDPVVEIPHYYSAPRARKREREHDSLTHNNHPGGEEEHDGSSEYLPVDLSAHRRSDLLELGGGEGKPTRRDSRSPSHDDDDDDEPDPPPTSRPSFFRNHVANGLELRYLLNPFPAPTPLSNNKISTIFARDHRIETRVRVCKDETQKTRRRLHCYY